MKTASAASPTVRVDDLDVRVVQRRTLRVLVFAQIFAGSGLAVGYLTGALGGAGVVIAAVLENVPLLLAALAVYGAGSATNLQCRYAGADLADDSRRGRAISTVLVATTFGAVAGPNLLRQTGELALELGLPRLTGPFLLATVAYATAGLIIATLLRPDPLLLALRIAAKRRTNDPDATGDTADTTLSTAELAQIETAHPKSGGSTTNRPLVLAASGMILAQAVMVALMSMTPVHLEDHHHGLGVVGAIIGLHIGFMYLPSPLTGRQVDQHGPIPVATAGAVVLVGAGGLGATAGPNAWTLAVALALLGLGWNLALIGGTAQVTALTSVEQRATTQGTVDLGVALAGATGGLASGAILAASSFEILALTTAALASVVIPTVAAARRQPAPVPQTR